MYFYPKTVQERAIEIGLTTQETIRDYKKPIIFWHGSNEPYPVKSVRLLKRYLPQLKERVFDNMGHGQMLNEHPSEYAKLVLDFMR